MQWNETSTESEHLLPALAQRDETLVSVEIAVLAVILLLTVGGNGLVLGMLVAMSRRKDLGRMYTMIGHLSCADLFVAMFNLLPQLVWDVTYRFHGGRVMCKLVKYWQVLVLYASSYVLVSTALDRYIAICHPMRSHSWTSASAHRLAAVAWLAAGVFAVPQLVIFDYVELAPAGSGVYDCWGHFDPEWTLPLYITWFAGAVYVIPLLFLAAVYMRICSVVWRSAASAPPLPSVGKRTDRSTAAPRSSLAVNSDSVQNCRNEAAPLTDADVMAVQSMSKAKRKTVKLTLTVVVSYIVCWGPFFVAQLWSAWDPLAPFEGKAMVIIVLLASLNSCTNPWIYMAFSDHLRHRLMWCCRATLHRSGATNTSSSAAAAAAFSCEESTEPLAATRPTRRSVL